MKNFNSNCIIIPHAGIKYSGEARKSIFNRIKSKIGSIIYITALHNTEKSQENVYILKEDTGFKCFFKNISVKYEKFKIPKGVKEEHSYKWVEDELNQFFPNVNKLVLCPTPDVNLDLFAKDIVKYLKNKIKCKKKVLLIGTTDLIHYGLKFQNLDFLSYPVQLDKLKKEENLIYDIINKNEISEEDKNMMCGPYSVLTIINVAKYMNWNGRVIDYYDSHGISKTKLIDRYSIDFTKNIEFVSYVSIMFGNLNKNLLLPIDIKLALGLLKSIINAQLIDYNIDNIKLPKWSVFNHKYNGIFVGTELLQNGKYSTNCSYGRYQSEKNSSYNIINASGDCYKDAKYRWNLMYTIDNLNSLSFKVEILQDKKLWKSQPSLLAPKLFKLDGKHGMFLELANGKSATYLPVVAKDTKNEWSIENYMEKLSKKAGGNKNDWKLPKSIMKIYTSISHIYYPDLDIIKKYT